MGNDPKGILQDKHMTEDTIWLTDRYCTKTMMVTIIKCSLVLWKVINKVIHGTNLKEQKNMPEMYR